MCMCSNNRNVLDVMLSLCLAIGTFRVRGKTIGDLSPENSEDSDDAVNLIRRKRAVQNPRKSTQVLTSDRRSELHDGNHSDTSVTESILTAENSI